MPKETKAYQKWLETACYLFAELGPKELNVKAVSEACGLPRPNFYYHFPDKEYKKLVNTEPEMYCFRKSPTVSCFVQCMTHISNFHFN